MSSKILITGGNGFIGLNIIEQLQSQGNEIYNLSNTAIDGIKNIQCDAVSFDFNTIEDSFDYIIHLLALSTDKYCQDIKLTNQINVDFTLRLLEFCRTQSSLKKLIFLSTITLYDDKNIPPVSEEGILNINHNNYTFTKGIAEMWVKYYKEKYNIPALIFRMSNIYGPHQVFKNSPFLIPSKIYQALTEKQITVFNLLPKRDWLYIDDAINAIILGMFSDFHGILNLGSGHGYTVKEIIEEICSQLKVPYTSLNKKVTGPQNFFTDTRLIQSVLNWQPQTPLQIGIERTIEYVARAGIGS